MKKVLLSIIFSCCISFVFGQRYYNSSGITLGGSGHSKGFALELGVEMLYKQDNGFYPYLYFSSRKEDVAKTTTTAKLLGYGAGFTYNRYFLDINNFYPFVGGGLYGGVENLQNSKDFSPTMLLKQTKTTLHYGGLFQLGADINFGSFSIVPITSFEYDIELKRYDIIGKINLKYYF